MMLLLLFIAPIRVISLSVQKLFHILKILVKKCPIVQRQNNVFMVIFY